LSKYKISVFKPDLPAPEQMFKKYREIEDCGVVSNFGKQCVGFENLAKMYLHNPNVLAVNSCDSGLIMSIAAMDIPKGSDVVLPSFTFTSTVNAVKWNGLNPVFADIDDRTFNVTEKTVSAALTKNTKLIMATHIFGNPVDEHSINDLAFDIGASVVYDSAHAYGSKIDGIMVGAGPSMGPLTAHVYSFSGTKLVTCGEGGLISTGRALNIKLEFMRAYGFLGDYNCKLLGLNGKISELNAAMGTLTLPTIESAIKKRYEIVAKYKSILGNNFEYQFIDDLNRTTYKDFAILCKDQNQRDRIYQHLENNGIQTKKYFMPLHHTDFYKSSIALPYTEMVYDRILCVPIFNSITDAQIDEVCERILECLM
jgi:dTDP-4-amino-4,6-dideoxygalactose transaminase